MTEEYKAIRPFVRTAIALYIAVGQGMMVESSYQQADKFLARLESDLKEGDGGKKKT